MTATPSETASSGVAILIPAAGGSTRMRGRDKLLEPVRGRPLLADRVAVAAAAANGLSAGPIPISEVVVTLPPRAVAPGRWGALRATVARCVEVTEHRAGLSASLVAGLGALAPDCTGVMILPADMPDITAGDIATLFALFDGESILRGASAVGRPGHPVLFPVRDFPALMTVTGDQGGREVLRAARDRVRLVALPGEHARTDLDTPEDWAVWRARQT